METLMNPQDVEITHALLWHFECTIMGVNEGRL
jgi:hypothetical protein